MIRVIRRHADFRGDKGAASEPRCNIEIINVIASATRCARPLAMHGPPTGLADLLIENRGNQYGNDN
jgi:hypothetical protein